VSSILETLGSWRDKGQHRGRDAGGPHQDAISRWQPPWKGTKRAGAVKLWGTGHVLPGRSHPGAAKCRASGGDGSLRRGRRRCGALTVWSVTALPESSALSSTECTLQDQTSNGRHQLATGDHAQLGADIRMRTRFIITAYTWNSYRLHGTKRRTHKKRKKAGKKQILLLLIVTYNDREARGEQCYVVCNPLLTSSFSCSCCSSHATSDEKIVPPWRINVTSFPIRMIEPKLLLPPSFDHRLIQKRRPSRVIIVLNMAWPAMSVMAIRLAPDRRDSHGSAGRLSICRILDETRVLWMPRDALMPGLQVYVVLIRWRFHFSIITERLTV